ncbi:hypothetical protein XF35_16740 [Streptomyces platensis subsp. clarensis]|nr:hypothetical protein [Streptomyces platensis subsp. clarensis]
MIRVQRIELPQQLADHAAELTETITAVAGQAARKKLARELWGHTTHRRKLVTPLRQVLRQMAHGNRCCMYCCSDLSTDVDHFEPLANNPLRTFDWLNHLLACTECNGKKADQFEWKNGEPLLIDPTREDPFEHLYLSLESGEYEGLTEKGIFTRDVCGLNRDDLPESRCQARDVVALIAGNWLHAWENGHERRMAIAVRTVQEQPFADVTQFMLRQAVLPKAHKVFDFELGPDALEQLRHPHLRAALLA